MILFWTILCLLSMILTVLAESCVNEANQCAWNKEPVCHETNAYSGTKNRTKDGLPCVIWKKTGHRDFSWNDNYCRNPDGDTTSGPWCFINAKTWAWKACFKQCPESVAETCVDEAKQCAWNKEPVCHKKKAYLGRKRQTKDGVPCVNWKKAGYKRTWNHKYCRNVDGDTSSGPWCFTNAKTWDWKSCFKQCQSAPKHGSCGVRATDSSTWRIIGGEHTAANSWPWLVDLRYQGTHCCGGSLVRVSDSEDESDIVVTAQHCIRSYPPSDFTVIVGQHSLKTPEDTEQMRRVVEIQVPEEGSGIFGYPDMAILKLDSPVKFNSAVGPVCLPDSDPSPEDNSKCIVSGWGDININPLINDYPDKPMEVVLPLISDAECEKAGYRQFDKESEICAAYPEGGKDSCTGDSGGPLHCKVDGRWVLTGVVSGGAGCAKAGSPGVYAQTSRFKPWLRSTICAISSISC